MSAQKGFDFGKLDAAEAAKATAPPRAAPFATRPDGWRAPTQGEHACAFCGGFAPYGVGDRWICRAHLPSDFLPAKAQGAAA